MDIDRLIEELHRYWEQLQVLRLIKFSYHLPCSVVQLSNLFTSYLTVVKLPATSDSLLA